MVKSKIETPDKIIAGLPDARVDLTQKGQEIVTASGEHVTPRHAVMIGAQSVGQSTGPDGAPVLEFQDGSTVTTSFDPSTGKPTHIRHQRGSQTP